MVYKKKLFLFISLISLFYCISIIENTYAKYVSVAKATSNLTMARWKIVVNNQDITENSDFSTTISPTFTENMYIQNGVLAPTSEGYFEIIVDATNTDVSFDYNVESEPSEDNNITDLEISKISINDVEYNNVDEIQYNPVMYNDTNKILNIKVYIKWNDGEGETMDNSQDVDAIKNGVANYNVIVRFTQKRES